MVWYIGIPFRNAFLSKGAFYIINWIYRYFGDEHHYDPIAIFAGIIQTVLYCDFFYLYVTKVMKGKRIEVLP